MRNLKKVLVLVLCLAMMASIMVTGVAAAFTDAKDIDSKHQEAVDMCVALSIINGYPDGSFQPNGNVTRAEMSKIICIALNGGQEPATAVKPTPSFKDIAGNWAEGFIEYCYAKGVVAGKSADVFDPNGNVTGSEAAKMLLVALGYNADVERYVGSDWALYVNVQANQDGLYDKLLDIETAQPLSREHAAQMIWNALQADIIRKDSQIDRSDGSISDIYTKQDGLELLEKSYNGETTTGIMESFEYNSTDEDWDYTIAGRTYNSANDYTALLGQDVKVVFDATSGAPRDTYGIFANKSVVKVTGLIADLPDLAATDTSFKVDGSKYKLDTGAANIPVYFFQNFNDYDNGAITLTAVAAKDVANYDAFTFTAVDQDGDGDVDFLMVQPYVVASVSFLSAEKVKMKTVPGNQPFYDATAKFFADKADLEDLTYYDGMAKNDYVVFTPARFTSDDTATAVKADLYSGKIAVKDGDDITVEGNTFTLDASLPAADKNDAKVGATVSDAVVVNGFVFAIDEFGKKDIKDFAVIKKLTGVAENSMNDNQAQLLFTDGTKTIVDTDENYYAGANKLAKNQLVTYRVNGDGEYQLKDAVAANVDGYDLQADGKNAVTVGQISNSNKNAGYINGAAITSSSVIYLMDKDGVKVVNGDQMKKMKAADFAPTADFEEAFVLGTKQSGNSNAYEVALAYVSVGNAKAQDADTYYGYVTGAVQVENASFDEVTQVTVWTTDGEKTLLTSSGNIDGKNNADIAKRSLIEYKVNSDGEMNEIVNVYDVDDSAFTAATADKDGFATIAATQWTPSIQFKAYAANGQSVAAVTDKVGGNFLETDSDTVYLYIENSDAEGADASALATADDFNDADILVPNAFIIFDADGAVSFVVYDVDNDIAK